MNIKAHSNQRDILQSSSPRDLNIATAQANGFTLQIAEWEDILLVI